MLTTTELGTLQGLYERADLTQLKAISAVIIAKINRAEGPRGAGSRIGQIIEFTDRAGNVQHAKITRVNGRTVTCENIAGPGAWRVPHSMVREPTMPLKVAAPIAPAPAPAVPWPAITPRPAAPPKAAVEAPGIPATPTVTPPVKPNFAPSSAGPTSPLAGTW